MKPKISFEKE